MDDLTPKIDPAYPKDPDSELAHITQEMYKKNFELVGKNTTLALLSKIEEIILSKVSDIKQIAQQVADVSATEAEFNAVAIYQLDKPTNSLLRLSVSQTLMVGKIQLELNKDFYAPKIEVNEPNNIIATCVRECKKQFTSDLKLLFTPYFSEAEIKKIEDLNEIKFSIIFPLVVRGQTMGAMVINLDESEDSIDQYEKDLIDRLVRVVGIALDNALLFQKTEEANEKLKELSLMKDEFLSVASHELRTPLTAIRGNSSMLKDYYVSKVNDKNFEEIVFDIHEGSVMLIGIVNDFLDMSRIESGRMQFNLTSVSLPLIIKKISEEINGLATQKGIDLIYEEPNGDLPKVLADATKCNQIIYNLVGNAIKFTEKGSVKISLVTVDSFVKVLVKDTGNGISPEKQQLLFHKFQQAGQNSLSRQSGMGSGLGLYISKLLVEAMGGEIKLEESVLNVGSVFSFTLPIANLQITSHNGTEDKHSKK